MRIFFLLVLLALAHTSYALEQTPEEWRCKPVGGNETYQKMVDDIALFMVFQGLKQETIQLLQKYREKPNTSALKQIRADNEDKCDGLHKPYNRIRDASHVQRSRHNKPPLKHGEAFYEKQWEEYGRIAWSYDVEFSAVTAILAKETWACEYPLHYPVLHALLTAAYFFNLARDDLYDPTNEIYYALRMLEEGHVLKEEDFKGSYLGAVGCPQFLPSSVHKYAVDQDGDGRIDLYGNHADIVGSISNYLSKFGWERGEELCQPVDFKMDNVDDLKMAILEKEGFYSGYSTDIIKTAQEWGEDKDLQLDIPEHLLEDGENYRFLFYYQKGNPIGCLAGDNFEAIRRYNFSMTYVLTIVFLMEEFQEQEMLINSYLD